MADLPVWRKHVDDALAKDDIWEWNSVYIEIDQSYTGRLISHAWGTFKRHRKGEAIGGAIVPPVAALVTGTLTGSLSTGLLAGFITLIGVLFVIFLAYLLAAPKELDEALRGDLNAARSQVLEEKRKLQQVALLIAENRIPVIEGEIAATKHTRDIETAEDAIEQISKCSEKGADLLRRARVNPGAGYALVQEIDAWEAECAECVARYMGNVQKTIFLSESPIEVYYIDSATSAHRNILNRINTKVVRLNRLLEQLSERIRLWSE